VTRLGNAWRATEPEQRLAIIASLALLVTMFFPWYGLQSLDRKTGAISSHSINAFGDVSFVEAAVFLVAAGVTAMVLARAEGNEFHLPGGDGTIVTIAGCWAAVLIFYRVFSRPAGNGYPVGIEWGFFLAFVAAGGLAYAGWRMRAGERPEPPLERSHARRRREPPPRAPTWGERDEPPAPDAGEEPTIVASAPRPRGRSRPVPTRGGPPLPERPSASERAVPPSRPRYPPAPPGQLSLEDEPPEPE
jgi:hypothetical protein